MDQQPAPPPTFDTAPGPPLPKKKTNVWLIVGIVAAVGSCPIAILTAILLPGFAHARESAREAAKLRACEKNLGKIGTAFEAYSAAHAGKYPSADKWVQAIEPHLGGVPLISLKCPKVEEGLGYAYNKASGNSADVQARYEPMLMETDDLKVGSTFGPKDAAAFRHLENHVRTEYYFEFGVKVLP